MAILLYSGKRRRPDDMKRGKRSDLEEDVIAIDPWEELEFHDNSNMHPRPFRKGMIL